MVWVIDLKWIRPGLKAHQSVSSAPRASHQVILFLLEAMEESCFLCKIGLPLRALGYLDGDTPSLVCGCIGCIGKSAS
jgi:hypothetical protein